LLGSSEDRHKLVVEFLAAISKKPIPRILSWALVAASKDLTPSWAQTADRKLPPKLTPQHGRADLAITPANQLALFDGLHGIPTIRISGLLPK